MIIQNQMLAVEERTTGRIELMEKMAREQTYLIIAQMKIIHAQATTIQSLNDSVAANHTELRDMRQRLEVAVEAFRRANVHYEAVLDELAFVREKLENQGDKPPASTSAPAKVQESKAEVEGDSTLDKNDNMDVDSEKKDDMEVDSSNEGTDSFKKTTDEKDEDEDEEEEIGYGDDSFLKTDRDDDDITDDDLGKGGKGGKTADDDNDDDDDDIGRWAIVVYQPKGDSKKSDTTSTEGKTKKEAYIDAEDVQDSPTTPDEEIPTSEAYERGMIVIIKDDGFIREEAATGKEMILFQARPEEEKEKENVEEDMFEEVIIEDEYEEELVDYGTTDSDYDRVSIETVDEDSDAEVQSTNQEPSSFDATTSEPPKRTCIDRTRWFRK